MLKQLQGLIEEDRDADTTLFNANGVRDVERLSKKCNKIYGGIVILLNKASEDGDKGQIKMETTANAIPDASIKTINLSFRRRMAWSWLEPRIHRCQQELRQVKLDLLLQVQVITLAQFKIKHPMRAPTLPQEEQDMREIATELMQKRERHAMQLSQRRLAAKRMEKRIILRAQPSSVQIDTIDHRSAPAILSLPRLHSRDLGATHTGLTTLAAGFGPSANPPKDDTRPASEEINDEEESCEDEAARSLPENDYQSSIQPDSRPSPNSNPRPVRRTVLIPSSDGEYTDGEAQDSTDTSNPHNQRRAETPAAPTFTMQKYRFGHNPLNLIPWLFEAVHGSREKEEALEAFLLEVPSDKAIKPSLTQLDAGHRQLKAALTRLRSRRWLRRRSRMWEQYRALSAQVRHEIHLAVTSAKQWSPKSRTWVAIEVVEPSTSSQQDDDTCVVLFFRVGEEIRPIHFWDAEGRGYLIPYECFRTWEMMQKLVLEMFSEPPDMEDVRQSRFDIVITSSQKRILPTTWTSLVSPGMSLKMQLWPSALPRSRPRRVGPPRFPEELFRDPSSIPWLSTKLGPSDAGPLTRPDTLSDRSTDRDTMSQNRRNLALVSDGKAAEARLRYRLGRPRLHTEPGPPPEESPVIQGSAPKSRRGERIVICDNPPEPRPIPEAQAEKIRRFFQRTAEGQSYPADPETPPLQFTEPGSSSRIRPRVINGQEDVDEEMNGLLGLDDEDEGPELGLEDLLKRWTNAPHNIEDGEVESNTEGGRTSGEI
ncbi:hypothetical protein NM208_g15067 [Fusarium decemcellulare]|uniref:Uncharacterized protein n=1 Tax=Fusarium decemcellulare TaxID=57161 RepID=A0ACC1RFX7_9HYPO|nr:hypothetical protein NM208_g15067 [Fusarium decemcellulare]